ncbi:hypothetical protein OXX79_008374 [Metschnikowia pulcherrima]
MEEYSAEQRHEMSPKSSQEDFFSTWATQANKHAGGVARACGRAIASASNEETFKPYMMQIQSKAYLELIETTGSGIDNNDEVAPYCIGFVLRRPFS